MNVKTGDLAIIIKSKSGKHVGLIVEVAGPWGNHKRLGFVWNCIAPRSVQAVTIGGKKRGMLPAGSLVQSPDDWLRPVSGIPEPIDITTEEDLGVPA